MKTLIRVAALGMLSAATAGAQVVYTNSGASTSGFGGNAAIWSTPDNCVGAYCGSYIGSTGGAVGYNGGGAGHTFSNTDVLSLSLSGLGAHTAGILSFTFLQIDSWDGSGYNCCGPDRFTVAANGTNIMDASFTDFDFGAGTWQSFPDPYSSGNTYLPGTGAAQTGLGSWYWTSSTTASSVYTIALAFNDASSNLVFDFTGLSDNQGMLDESWALQAVQVQLNGRDVIGTPEPASITLFATGLAGLGVAVRRRKRNA